MSSSTSHLTGSSARWPAPQVVAVRLGLMREINAPRNVVSIATFGSKGAHSARSEGHLPT
jgi:hypothetical protein